MSNFCQQGDITKIFIVDTGNTGSTGNDIYVTGGTYSNGTLTLGRNDGVSILISGFLTGVTDTYITGGTYSDGTLILGRNDGINISISGFSTTAIFTGNTSANCISDLYISNLHGCSPITIWDPINSLSSISATTYYGDGSNLTGIPDYYVTGGTYSNGILTLNRQNGSVTISGLLSADTYVTGFTFNTGTYDLTIFQNNGVAPLTQNLGILAGDITVTGGTYNPNNGVATFYNNAGGSFQVSGFLTAYTDIYLSSGSYNPNTGNLTLTRTDNVSITVTGFTDYFVTGGTYSNGSLTLNRQNGSVTILGFLTGTTTDTFVTGFTYNGTNQLTISQNQGQPNLSVTINNLTLTGLTVNGSVSATTYFGNGQFLTGIASTDNFVTGGTYTSSTGTLTLNRQNGSVSITGFSDNFVTGGTFNTSNRVLTLNRQNGSFNISGITDTFVTGFTYSNNNLTINQSQGQSPLTVNISTMTGLTVNGNILVNGYVSATTIYNTSGNSFLYNITASTMFVDWIDFNQNATVPTANGRISWDSGTGTLNIGVGDSTTGTIDLQVGQEEIVRVYNSEATTLTKGTVVYVSGSQGNRPAVKRAIATNDGYSVTTLGIVDSNITSGAQGYVTTFGIISNLDTTGYSGGTAIWLSPYSAGTFTSIKPIAPDHTVLLGYVVRVDNNVGSIFVNISNGWEIDELHDVRISGSTVGDLLVKSSYNGSPVWVNSKTLTGDYLINGNLNITGTTISNVLSATTVYTTSLGVSGNCVTDAYIGNLYGCSPITVHDSIQSIGSSATGITSFAFGNVTVAAGNYSHAEGDSTQAIGSYSHAEGTLTISSGNGSHAEGLGSNSSGVSSHAQGAYTTSSGSYSFASGSGSTAQGDFSFVHSLNSVATGVNTVILGGQNITGTTSNMVYVSDLNINSTPTNNNSATQILVRNSSTGDVEYRDVSTITGTTQPIAQFSTITGGTLVSGTTNNTISQSLLIPANSRTAGQVPTITFGVRKSGGSNTHQPRLYWNTGVTLTNAILVASNAAHAAATQSSFTIRDLSILVANGTGSGTNLYSTTSNANSPYGVVSAQPSNIAINWTIDGYFIVAITNASASDSSASLFISLK